MVRFSNDLLSRQVTDSFPLAVYIGVTAVFALGVDDCGAVFQNALQKLPTLSKSFLCLFALGNIFQGRLQQPATAMFESQ